MQRRMVCFRVQIWCGWGMTGNFEWFFDVLNHWLPFNERFEQNLTTLTRTEWRERGHTKARGNEDGRELKTFKTILKWQKLNISGSIFSMDEMNVDATVAWGIIGSGSLDWKEIYSSKANSQKFQAKHGRWKRGRLINTCWVDVNISFMLHNNILTTELN